MDRHPSYPLADVHASLLAVTWLLAIRQRSTDISAEMRRLLNTRHDMLDLCTGLLLVSNRLVATLCRELDLSADSLIADRLPDFLNKTEPDSLWTTGQTILWSYGDAFLGSPKRARACIRTSFQTAEEQWHTSLVDVLFGLTYAVQGLTRIVDSRDLNATALLQSHRQWLLS